MKERYVVRALRQVVKLPVLLLRGFEGAEFNRLLRQREFR